MTAHGRKDLEQGAVEEGLTVDHFFPKGEILTKVDDAKEFVTKWVHSFGFGHYQWRVLVMRQENAGEYWARAFFDHDEEWFELEFVPDGVLPKEQVEFLVLHEFAHGLFDYASAEDSMQEAACNRLARLLSGQANGANYTMYANGYWRTLPPESGNGGK